MGIEFALRGFAFFLDAWEEMLYHVKSCTLIYPCEKPLDREIEKSGFTYATFQHFIMLVKASRSRDKKFDMLLKICYNFRMLSEFTI